MKLTRDELVAAVVREREQVVATMGIPAVPGAIRTVSRLADCFRSRS